jgi:glycosyltransferase involved in cell wall biosynthesis
MRIALFLPHLGVSGGLGVYCRSLLSALLQATRSDTFEVLAPAAPQRLFPYSGPDESWRALVADTRVRLTPLDWPPDHPLALPLDRVLAKPLGALTPDLVHCTYYSGLTQTRCPQLITFHDAGFLEFAILFGDTARQRRDTIAQIEPAIKRIICQSEDARRRVCRLLPFDEARTEVVHLALSDTPEELQRARRPDWLTRSLWPEGDTIAQWGTYFFLPVGAATGFNRPRKNVPTAVAAFRKLPPGRARLIIASTGILHDRLLSELLPVTEIAAGRIVDGAWRSRDDAIRLLPNLERDEFLAAMAHAWAIVYPSRYEGFGLPTIEAMALEVPLIAGQAASIPEIVHDAGLLVDPDDVAGFAAALERILTDPQLGPELVRRGRERVKSFTLVRMGEELRKVYERALG